MWVWFVSGFTAQAQLPAEHGMAGDIHLLDSLFPRVGYYDSTVTLKSLTQNFLQKGEKDLQILKNHIRPFTFSRKDSGAWKNIAALFQLQDTINWKDRYLQKLIKPVEKSIPLVQLTGGYISYNGNYRSRLDSPFTNMGLGQHLVAASANFTLAGQLPLTVSYFGRETSSPYFKDYRDLRVDFDSEKFRQLKTAPLRKHILQQAHEIRNPFVEQSFHAAHNRMQQFSHLLEHPSITKELIQAKEILIREYFADTSALFKDSIKAKAQAFISFYDSVTILKTKYRHLYDSLQLVRTDVEAKIQRLRKLAENPNPTPGEAAQLALVFGGQSTRVAKWHKALQGIRSFSAGRTLPSYSQLTLQNLNVNGINVEYNKNKFYWAATAGAVDFRMRDFLFQREKPVPQYVYLARGGYGTKEKDHVILTYFRGKKQLFGSTYQTPAEPVQGLSLTVQYRLGSHTRLTGELAQSGMRRNSVTGAPQKRTFDFGDRAQRAYALGLYSHLPTTGTRLEGYYQQWGHNYQSFNSFQYNGSRSSWSARVEQPFFHHQLNLVAGVRQNDFTNPLLFQRFNSQSVYKTINLSFRKPGWPAFSFGYLPTSQQTVIDSAVYENHYQALTGSLVHQYDLGFARCNTVFMISRYFNDSSDSSLFYFNARNIFWQQTFAFRLYTATLSASLMTHHGYKLYVLEEGWNATFFKKVNLGFTVRINHLRPGTTKLGFKTSTGFALKQIGLFNLWAEESYLPTAQNSLFKYKLYNLGFTRYFN
jgi:hypothetical protein